MTRAGSASVCFGKKVRHRLVPGDKGWNGLIHSFETEGRTAVPIRRTCSRPSMGNGSIPFPQDEARALDPCGQTVT